MTTLSVTVQKVCLCGKVKPTIGLLNDAKLGLLHRLGNPDLAEEAAKEIERKIEEIDAVLEEVGY